MGEIDCLAEGAVLRVPRSTIVMGTASANKRAAGEPVREKCDPAGAATPCRTNMSFGKAQSDMPTSVRGHSLKECSNAGFCDRLTGTCQCFPGFAGTACQSKTCPNDCSGKGLCLTMRQLAKMKDALPLNDGYTSVNNTDDLTNLPEPGDPTQNIR